MNNLESIIIPKLVESFVNNFLVELNQLVSLDVKYKTYLPSVFKKKSLKVLAIYSLNLKNILFIFEPSDKLSIDVQFVYNDIVDYFDKTGSWLRSNKFVFSLEETTNVKFDNVGIEGMKPFRVLGTKSEIYLDNFSFKLPDNNIYKIRYGFIFSNYIFAEKSKEIKEFVFNLFSYYKQRNTLYKSFKSHLDLTPKQQYLVYLSMLKEEMHHLFFDENVLEHEIDNFLENHFFILEVTLGLIKPLHQTTLRDISSKYNQDLKPDLIAYNNDDKVWTIVDYKRAKRKIIKNVGGVRASLKAEVHDLIAQLGDYIEYFDDNTQRQFIMDNYGINIKYPVALGIIGNVITEEEHEEFNKIRRREGKSWYNLKPYNYIYDKFCNFISFASKMP